MPSKRTVSILWQFRKTVPLGHPCVNSEVILRLRRVPWTVHYNLPNRVRPREVLSDSGLGDLAALPSPEPSRTLNGTITDP